MHDQVRILHSDESVVAVAKPSGIPVVPAPDLAPDACLRAVLERQVGERLWVVHRLDRDVSGVIVFARTAEAHRELCQAFEHRAVRKTYLAFTAGVPDPARSRIDTPLHAARKGKTRPAAETEPGAQAAATAYAVRRTWHRAGARVSLIDVHPETGRHHQIRVHLRSIGTPILFDDVYGKGIDAEPFEDAPCERIALHASRLVLPTPAGAPLDIEAPLPADLTALLRWLDGEWDVLEAG